MDQAGRNAVIVGAGLAGSLLACYLAKRGWHVSIYERRSDPRAAGFIGGRSINLALSARGIRGLEGVGLDKIVLQDAIPMRGRMMHDRQGNLAYQAYSKNSTDAINSVSRGKLNLTLIEAAAKYPNVRLFFDHRCLDVDLDDCTAMFQHDQHGVVSAKADLIVGADGAFSAVRAKMQRNDRFEYSQSYLTHGYKELHIPPKNAGEFSMEKNALHIWPRGSSMMIALSNPDGSFTCTLFWPFEGPMGFEAFKTDHQIRRHFQEHYPDFPPLSPGFVEDYARNPTSSLVTVKCAPWYMMARDSSASASGGRGTVLVGDAAHAIVPFYGQGMNAAFEDVRELAEQLDKHGHGADLGGALAAYYERRKENADAIAEMAVDNFIEMRDKVASRAFRWKKKFSHALHGVMPNWYIPLYEMVSFTTIPYAAARRRATKQSEIVTLTVLTLLALIAGMLVGVVRDILR